MPRERLCRLRERLCRLRGGRVRCIERLALTRKAACTRGRVACTTFGRRTRSYGGLAAFLMGLAGVQVGLAGRWALQRDHRNVEFAGDVGHANIVRRKLDLLMLRSQELERRQMQRIERAHRCGK